MIAGVGNGPDRLTHIRAVDRPLTDLAVLPGGDASFCPDGRRIAFVKVARTPAVSDAQSRSPQPRSVPSARSGSRISIARWRRPRR